MIAGLRLIEAAIVETIVASVQIETFVTLGIELCETSRGVDPIAGADQMLASVKARVLKRPHQVGAQPRVVVQQLAGHHHLARCHMGQTVVFAPAFRRQHLRHFPFEIAVQIGIGPRSISCGTRSAPET